MGVRTTVPNCTYFLHQQKAQGEEPGEPSSFPDATRLAAFVQHQDPNRYLG